MAVRTLRFPLTSISSPLLFQAGNFLYWLALYFYVPILPAYAQSMGASLTLVGVMLSAYGAMQLLLRIPVGVASDRIGKRKPFVVAGLALTVAGALAFAWAPAPWMLVVARAITGLAACAWVVITVLYSGYFPPAQATNAIGLMGLTNGLGQIVATWVGGQAALRYGWGAPFALSAAAGALGMGLMAAVREPEATARAAAPMTPMPPMPWRRLWRVATSSSLLVISVLSAINTYATFTTVFGFTPVYAQRIGAGPAELGLLTALSLVPALLAQSLTASVTARIGFAATISSGLVLTGIMTLAIPWARAFPVLAATQFAGGAGRGLVGTSLMSLAILSVDQRERATAMGVYQAVYAVGMFLGPLFGGVIAERSGLPTVFVTTGAICLATGLAAWFAPLAHRRRPDEHTTTT